MEKFLKMAAGVAATAALGYVAYRAVKAVSSAVDQARAEQPKQASATRAESSVVVSAKPVPVERKAEPVSGSRLTLPGMKREAPKRGPAPKVDYELVSKISFDALLRMSKGNPEMAVEVAGTRISVQRMMGGRLHTVYCDGDKLSYLRPVGMLNEKTSYETVTDGKMVFWAIGRLMDGDPTYPASRFIQDKTNSATR